ncbi:MAG: M15 family metallopeptidase [Magnetococcales bacterium]|nr:M15 family metallopeptidase [Magnetococcales bacterium]
MGSKLSSAYLSQTVRLWRFLPWIMLGSITWWLGPIQTLAAQALVAAYPDHIRAVTDQAVIWQDGEVMPLDSGHRPTSLASVLDRPNLKDQLALVYPKGRLLTSPARNVDPGRIRYEPFFKKMYGATEDAVRQQLVAVSWLPGSSGQKLLLTRINAVDQRVAMLVQELSLLPDSMQRVVAHPAGSFHWRTIAGTNRMSAHSFGIAIDIDMAYSDYWRWHADKEEAPLAYRNRIPHEVVEMFEKHGFIWGGKWYHYDTMHFEFRPELLTPQ